MDNKKYYHASTIKTTTITMHQYIVTHIQSTILSLNIQYPCIDTNLLPKLTMTLNESDTETIGVMVKLHKLHSNIMLP